MAEPDEAEGLPVDVLILHELRAIRALLEERDAPMYIDGPAAT